jgi:hypothetical protein
MDSLAAGAMAAAQVRIFFKLQRAVCVVQICMAAAYDRDKKFRFPILGTARHTEYSSPPRGGGNPDSSPSAGEAVTTAPSPVSFLAAAARLGA